MYPRSNYRQQIPPPPPTDQAGTAFRIQLLFGTFVFVVMLFCVRLFYVQIIRYNSYKTAALSDQLKQYEIPAARGLIKAHDGSLTIPIVLNQELFTLYADPGYLKQPDSAAAKLAAITGGDRDAYARLMRTPNTRYVVLARKLSSSQSQQILALKLPGIGTQGQDYRTYPQGSTAAQVVGYVDSDGAGQYGLEQAFDTRLRGTPGKVKAVTDVFGVPLAATKGNTETAPVDGDTIVTTLDLPMQVHMEQILKDEFQKTHSHGISAVIMDPNTGAIKAMANYPSFDPANYQTASDPRYYQNAATSDAIEPGSIMKVLTAAAALDQGAVNPDTTFYDPAQWVINGFTIRDIEEDGGAREQSVGSILSLSLNTGATWLLMQMSHPGGTEINSHGIATWHDYMVNHYRLGKPTNVEQGYEQVGTVPPTSASDLQYANTAFGQGVQVTALQMASALSSVVNGGTYFQPTLIDQLEHADGSVSINKPKVVGSHVVKPSTSAAMLPLMEGVVKHYLQGGFGYMAFPAGYMVGGKTGTAQIAKISGGYYDNEYNGTYLGFVGGDHTQYVICVFNYNPNVAGYAGSNAGQPVFADLAHMLINNSYVTPQTK